METIIVTCEKCGSQNVEFVGILRGVETWRCKDCQHTEEYADDDTEVEMSFMG